MYSALLILGYGSKGMFEYLCIYYSSTFAVLYGKKIFSGRPFMMIKKKYIRPAHYIRTVSNWTSLARDST